MDEWMDVCVHVYVCVYIYVILYANMLTCIPESHKQNKKHCLWHSLMKNPSWLLLRHSDVMRIPAHVGLQQFMT